MACSMAYTVDSVLKGQPSCLGLSYLLFIPSLDEDLVQNDADDQLPFSRPFFSFWL